MLSFKGRPQNSTFDYKPRFYDAEKEALQERLAKYKQEGKDNSIESAKHNIRAGFRSSSTQSDPKYRSKMVLQSNMRLLMIIGILCVIVYMVLQSEKVLKMMEAIG
jgi:hypothetical protein